MDYITRAFSLYRLNYPNLIAATLPCLHKSLKIKIRYSVHSLKTGEGSQQGG